MSTMKVLALALVVSATAASQASADVQLVMQDGRVTIVAKDATLRQILTEWARIGRTTIVNLERIPGGPVTIELTSVPEEQALDILLRSVSGFMAASRDDAAGNISRFDRIVVIPTIATARLAPGPAPVPTFTAPPQMPPDDGTDDERPAPAVGAPAAPARGPVFNTFPQPQVVNPQQGVGAQPQYLNPQTGGAVFQPQVTPQPTALTPSTAPSAPYGGVSVPGMVAPPPPQPGQVPAVGPNGVAQPGQPVRRPGGPGGQSEL